MIQVRDWKSDRDTLNTLNTRRKRIGKRATTKRKAAVLNSLGRSGVVSYACEMAGVSRNTFNTWMRIDPEFVKVVDEIIEITTGMAENELYRRAVEGYDKPLVYKGEIVGTYKGFSDSLLKLFLQSRKPDVYRDQQTIEHKGEVLIWDASKPQKECPSPS